jgi:hypothetical protein
MQVSGSRYQVPGQAASRRHPKPDT